MFSIHRKSHRTGKIFLRPIVTRPTKEEAIEAFDNQALWRGYSELSRWVVLDSSGKEHPWN